MDLTLLPLKLVFLEYGINETELYQYDLTTKKSTNITKELGEVKLFQVSPDQKQVAVLSTNPEVDTYFVNLISLATVSLIKKITSFPVPQKLGNNLAPNAIYDSAQLYSLVWSPDSQFLYFTSGGASRDINGNIINTLVINQVLSDGTGLLQLTDPDKISFQPSLSPDGKQIVYVSGEDLKLNIMNSDGTNKRILDSRNSASEIYQPIWSPDNKQLAYFQKRSSDSLFQFSIININGKTIKNFPIAVLYHLPLLKDLHLQNTFSPNAINIAFIKNYRSDPYQSTIIFLKDLKEEISLKGNNIGFRWSPDGNQMLLFEATTNDQLIGIFLYDCSTNSYAPISQDVQQIFDACWSPDGKQILYAGSDSKTGQIVFKASQADGSNQKVLFTFGENPLERPSSIEKIEKLVWLK